MVLCCTGIMFMRKGDQASLSVQVTGDGDYVVQIESGFSMVLLP